MYNKVQHYWQQQLTELQNQLTTASDSDSEALLRSAEREQLTARIQYLEETDMAVVISSSQNEEEAFKKKGLTIKPHRQRLAKEKPGLDLTSSPSCLRGGWGFQRLLFGLPLSTSRLT
jgi:type I restriction enzyme R subunit